MPSRAPVPLFALAEGTTSTAGYGIYIAENVNSGGPNITGPLSYWSVEGGAYTGYLIGNAQWTYALAASSTYAFGCGVNQATAGMTAFFVTSTGPASDPGGVSLTPS